MNEVRDTSGLVVNALMNKQTSEKYRFINTTDIFDMIEKVMRDRQLSYTVKRLQSRALKNTTHAFRITLDNHVTVNKDIVKPQIYLRNSYNGESSFQIMVGLFRLVCSNGLVLGENFFKERITHIQGPIADNKLLHLEVYLNKAIDWVFKYLESSLNQTSNELSYEKELKIIEGLKLTPKQVSDLTAIRHDNHRLSGNVRDADKPRSAWVLYNVINEYLKQKSRSELRFFNRNTTLFDNIIELSKAA